MTYQGARARQMSNENQRVFEVSKIRMAADGHPSHVLWAEVNSKSNQAVSKRVLAPVAEVVDAIHDGAQVVAVFTLFKAPLPERAFLIVEHDNGRQCIAFDDSQSLGRNLSDIAKLDS